MTSRTSSCTNSYLPGIKIYIIIYYNYIIGFDFVIIHVGSYTLSGEIHKGLRLYKYNLFSLYHSLSRQSLKPAFIYGYAVF